MESLELLPCCKKHDAKFVSTLAGLVFDTEVLRKSSITGQSKLIEDVQQLDPVKYTFIKSEDKILR
jgi:hypothetical protein